MNHVRGFHGHMRPPRRDTRKSGTHPVDWILLVWLGSTAVLLWCIR
jgi:hypothetical protein